MDGRSCRQNKRYGIYLIGIYQDLLFKIAATVNELFGSAVSFHSSEMSSHVAAKGLLTCKVPFFQNGSVFYMCQVGLNWCQASVIFQSP